MPHTATHSVPAPVAPLAQVPFDHRIVANEYGFYCVPESYMQREVPQVLARGAVYEPDTLRFLARILARGGDIICGGAFVGDFFPALSQALTTGAMLHSFEPNPIARDAASHTMLLNTLDNVALYPCAVGAGTGTLNLQVTRPNGEAMAARAKIVETAAEGQTIEIPVCRIDDLVDRARQITLLQLDIEGHEPKALEGAVDTVRTWRPYILVEAERPAKQRRIARLLAQLCPQADYTPAGIIERNTIYLPRSP
ncbi:MAG: FkbM family methyltransferase [Pseudomonadota bacterium]